MIYRIVGKLLTAVCVGLLAACGEQVTNQPATSANDLCMSDFQNCVMPVLSGQIRRRGGAVISCMDSNCHVAGGSGGRFSLGSDVSANFRAAKNLVNLTNPSDSLLLVEPTQDDVAPSAVAGTHGGGEIFPSKGDACYLAISNWVRNQVPDQTSLACGSCAPIASTFASCGYP